jgi:hypothetical protein
MSSKLPYLCSKTWFEDFKLQQCFAAFWNAHGRGTAGITRCKRVEFVMLSFRQDSGVDTEDFPQRPGASGTRLEPALCVRVQFPP